MPKPTTKAGILDEIRSERKKLDDVIKSISGGQMLIPGVQGVWSIKDIVAHVTHWEQHMVDRIMSAAQGSDYARKVISIDGDIDTINAEVYEANKDRKLTDVLEAIEPLSQDDLFDPIRLKAVTGYTEKYCAWRFVYWNTFDHYPRHRKVLEDWIASV